MVEFVPMKTFATMEKEENNLDYYGTMCDILTLFLLFFLLLCFDTSFYSTVPGLCMLIKVCVKERTRRKGKSRRDRDRKNKAKSVVVVASPTQ